jgi:hypothetical protein
MVLREDHFPLPRSPHAALALIRHPHQPWRLMPLLSVFLAPMQAGISAWAINLFQEKDELLAYFDAHGRFPGEASDLPRTGGVTVIVGILIYSAAAVVGAGLCAYMYGVIRKQG